MAPPGTLKTTLIRLALEDYPDALLLSDLNVNTLNTLKNSLIDQRYTTIGFGEFEKLYQRNPATAANIEGHLKMLVEEGYTRASFEDQRVPSMPARCAIIGGLTPSCYSRMVTKWLENGFARRFIFSCYTLANPDAIMESIEKWKHISLGRVLLQSPGNKKIPYDISPKENKIIRDAIAKQPTFEGPFVICKKAFCVLKWRHGAKRAGEIFFEFSESMESKGGYLELC